MNMQKDEEEKQEGKPRQINERRGGKAKERKR